MKKQKKKLKISTPALIAFLVGIVAFLFGLGFVIVKNTKPAPWIGLSIITLGLLFIVLGIFLYRRQYEKHEPDYRTFFNLGIIFFVIGIASQNTTMWVMGLAFLIIGLVNKDKWKKQRKWSELSDKERRYRIIILIVLGVLVMLGFVMLLLAQYNLI